MSFPKLNDFIGKGMGKAQYKRLSLIRSIKNSLTRNTIVESCKKPNNPNQNQSHSTPKSNTLLDSLQRLQSSSTLNYEQKMPASFRFSTEDMYKLLEHLFNKKQHDLNDRNFIRRLMLKYFPEELICAGGRDFVSLLKFGKLRKGERKIFGKGFINNNQSQQNPQLNKHGSQNSQLNEQKSQKSQINEQKSQNPQINKQRSQNPQLNKRSQLSFYFILKGQVRVFTKQFTYKKVAGQYFGELQILTNHQILQIEAKSDTMLLYSSEQVFNNHLAQYFSAIYSQIRKKISLFEPILNLAPLYNQYKFLQCLHQKQYKTGDKIYQKGEQIVQIVFLNHTHISSTEDRFLNEFKVVGLGQVLGMQRPKAIETTYCMDNKTVYTMKASDLTSFIQKGLILTYLSHNYNFSTINGTKFTPTSDEGTRNNESSIKLSTFVNIKRVRFTGNKHRVLTQPNLSISLHSPTSSKKSPVYPQYATSFVFIKENSSLCFKQIKNRLKGLRAENSRKTDIKDYLTKNRDTFRKKRWLDQIDGEIEQSIIFNPQKMANYQTTKDPLHVREFTVQD